MTALLACSVLFTSGCTQIKGMLRDAKKPEKTEVVKVTNIEGDISTEVVAGGAPQASMRLWREGDVAKIRNNTEANVDVSGFDPTSEVIVTEVVDGGNELVLRVAKKSNVKVRLSSKCQVYTIGNTDVLPPIEIAKGLDPQQVIITPLCDGVNSVIGYEIRYGAVDAGCRNAAKKGLERYRLCDERRSKPPHSPPIHGPCKYFGVGC
ncbi:MAG: hypothetical protein FGM32_09095 [Candidatus Kapabacteria bacterium]|nr:hypothetical protein [Candidatus Kapabacteria bacterium]